MTHDQTMEMIKRHEGYRSNIYLDIKGVPTGGHGHAFLTGSELPAHIWDKIFWYDYYNALQDYDKLKLNLDSVRKGAIIDVLFNMGLTNFLEFKKTIAALRSSDWQKAHDELLDSDAARDLPKRYNELANILFTGEYPV